jgi:hypothetical protein
MGALLALWSLALLSACVTDNGATDSGETDNEAVDDQSDTPVAGQPRVAEIDPADVLVEQTVHRPGNPDDQLTLGVLSLRVEGAVMVLHVVVTPHFASVDEHETVSSFDVFRPRRFAPVLVDRTNLKEYSVISDNGSYWVSEGVESRNGEPMVLWAVYAAPEDDIDTIEVRVADSWPPFLDVPIER